MDEKYLSLSNMDVMMLLNTSMRLALEEQDSDLSIQKVLEFWGQELESDRSYIFEIRDNRYFNTYEWCRDGVKPEIQNLQGLNKEVDTLFSLDFAERGYTIVRNVEDVKESDPALYEALSPQDLTSVVLCPIYHDGELLGLYGVDNPPVDKIEGLTGVLPVIGNFLDSLIIRRNLKNDLEEVSLIDPLTKLQNKRALDQRIASLDERHSCGVFFCDVTGLKKVNDTEGHGAGDALLLRVSRNLRETFKDSEVYRIGGDEFVVLQQDVSEDAMEAKARELKTLGKIHHAPLAIGYVWSAYSVHLDAMIDHADAKMYQDKQEYYDRLRKQAEQGTTVNLDTDEVTGLLNSGYFYESAQSAIDAGLHEEPPYLVYFDIVDFNMYNVQYGPENGNWVLKYVADMIQNEFHKSLVCRYAEDHFTVLTFSKRIEEHIEHIIDDFKMTYGNEGIDLRAGICKIDDYCSDIALACSYAKIACEAIKNDFHRKYSYYDEKIEHLIEVQDFVVHGLDRAIHEKNIKVYFQPIFRTLTNELCEFEVLARWIDPERGFLSPADFIGPLEESHQIYKLDIYVVNEVCRILRERLDQGKMVVPVSLNISRIDLMMCDIIQEVDQVAKEYNIDPEMIHIEITESVLLSDVRKVIDTSDQFRRLHYSVWMDDFGDGYSTLNMLDTCDFDLVKLDMGFLRRFNEKSKTIIENVVRMAKQLGIHTLAEGVETQEQYDFLRRIGCEKVQGFLLGKPMPMEDALVFLEENHGISGGKNMSQYYDSIGQVEFTTDKPLGIYELMGEQVKILYWNQFFLDVFVSTGLSDIHQVEEVLNHPELALSVHFRKFLRSIKDPSETYHFDYTARGHYVRLKIRLIAVQDEQAVFQIENVNLTNDKNVVEEI